MNLDQANAEYRASIATLTSGELAKVTAHRIESARAARAAGHDEAQIRIIALCDAAALAQTLFA